MPRKKKHTYSVRTWDMDEQAWTPQVGLRKWRGLTIHQLRRALKKLRRMGYECYRVRCPGGCYDSDPSVLVERDDRETDGRWFGSLPRRVNRRPQPPRSE